MRPTPRASSSSRSGSGPNAWTGWSIGTGHRTRWSWPRRRRAPVSTSRWNVSERGPGLTVRSLSVRFGGVVALEAVDLQVGRGEIVGLVGPNGAGKSTLVNCVGGQLEQSSGSVTLAGVSLDGKRPYRRARLGVGRTFQRVALFPELTVEAHLLLALRAGRGRRAR